MGTSALSTGRSGTRAVAGGFLGGWRALALVTWVSGLLCAQGAVADSVYRWVDIDGVTHISSTQPAGNVKADRIDLGRTSSAPRHSASVSSADRSGSAASRVTPAQAAERESLLAHLRERECVYALESLDRIEAGKKSADAAERQRVQQTVNLNCSNQPQRRSEQQALAAKLRVANGVDCLEARNQLAAMLEPGRHPQRAQLQALQEFIEAHCTAPVR